MDTEIKERHQENPGDINLRGYSKKRMLFGEVKEVWISSGCK